MRWALSLAAIMIGATSVEAAEVGFARSERAIIRTLARTPDEPLVHQSERVSSERAAARLGRDLFFDPRLAGNNAWSCATCHQPPRGWGDSERTPSRFARVDRNTQALWDLARERSFFWDGRVRELWRQALEPIESPNEMNGHRVKVALLIFQDQHLLRDYSAIFEPPSENLRQEVEDRVRRYPHGYDIWHNAYRSLAARSREAVDRMFMNVGRALAAFQRLLTSGVSRFDRFANDLFARGRSDILSTEEQHGLKLFVGRARCVSCHSGQSFSDGRLHDIYVSEVDRVQASSPAEPVTAQADGSALTLRDPRLRIKTPRLRNVALTAPYMHDGRLESLEAVLNEENNHARSPHRVMRELTAQDRQSLVSFLRSLTNERYSRRDPGGLYAVDEVIRNSQ